MRRLHHDVVDHPVLRVKPERRRRLRTARQRDQHVLPDVGRAQAELLQPRAVHLQINHRTIEPLVYVGIDRPGNLAYGLGQLGRARRIANDIIAGELHIDGCGQAEVQDLRRNIGRLEEKLHAGEALWQLGAQQADEFICGPVPVLQRHQYLAIHRAYGACIAVRKVDAAVGQANIVQYGFKLVRRHQFADHGLHRIGDARGFLNAGAGRRAHVQADLSGIHAREEIAPQHRVQEARQQAKTQEQVSKAPAVRQRGRQCQGVGTAHALELRVEAAVQPLQQARLGIRLCCIVHAAHQQHHQCRHQRARQDVGGKHREHHRLGQRHEQETRDSGEKKHGHEHDADTQRGDKGRDTDFASANFNGLIQRRAHVQVPLYVFNRHDGLVNQDTDREREPAKRHQVECLAKGKKRQYRSQDGQRNRQRNDQRAAPVAQEQQHHHGSQAGGDQRLGHHALHGCLDEHRLVEQRRHLDVCRQGLHDARQQGLHVGHDIQRGSAAIFQYRDQHAAHAILAHHIGLRLEAITHMGHITHVSGDVVDRAHRQVVEAGQRIGRAVHAHGVFGFTELDGSRGQDQVLSIDGIDYVCRRQATCLQGLCIEIDGYHAHLAAIGKRRGDTRNSDELGTQAIDRHIKQCVLCQCRAGQGELHHRNTGCGILDHQRRRDAGRQLPHLRLHRGHNLRNRRLDIDAWLEEHLDDADAGQRGRLDVLDVTHYRGQAALGLARHALAHLLGRQAVVVPDHADHRDVDLGENVRRHVLQNEWRSQHDQHRHHDKRVGAP
ncbi:hypothetical protein D9M73_89690 [compost metagenome]